MAEAAASVSGMTARRPRKTAAQRQLEKICTALAPPRRALVESVASDARDWIGNGRDRRATSDRVALWFTIINAIETAESDAAAEGVARLFARVFDVAPLVSFTMWNQPWRELPQGIHRQLHGLIALGQRAEEWVRDVDTWQFELSNSRPALAQLARHLLVKWEMPPFMDTVWLNDGWVWKEYHDWYVHIGQGGSPRCAGAPVEMSKQQVAFFAEVPASWSLPEHVWRVRAYIEARGLGAEPSQAVQIGCSLLGDSRLSFLMPERRMFWLSVLRFLVRHPEYPQRQIDPLVNFLEAQKFSVNAPAPGFTMKGRSPEMLLREMIVWQESMNRGANFSGPFKPSGRRGFRLEMAEGKGAWVIGELLSSRDLLEEGLAMRHCVANYIPHCATGRTSMWSLKRMSRTGRMVRKLTIEVDMSGAIAQARGLGNRWPTADEMLVIEEWAQAENLVVALAPQGRPPPRR